MKTKNSSISHYLHLFNCFKIGLKREIVEYTSQRKVKKNRKLLFRLGDHLLHDIGFEDQEHLKKQPKD